MSGLKQSKTAKFGAVFRIVPHELSSSSSSNTKHEKIILQTQEKKKSNNISNETTNKNSNTNLIKSPENISKKMDTNILSGIAPKLSNTTKIIDTKAWDQLFMQRELQ